ncbi:MAG: isocitrate/isopropylmalate family dehydrogenase [Myxococcota bacterium]
MQSISDRGVQDEGGDALKIGLIHGGGTGPELIDCVRRVLSCISETTGQRFETADFDHERWGPEFDEEVYNEALHSDLLEFYNAIQSDSGVIVRGSLPAPVLYRLRGDLRQTMKLVPLNPFPGISSAPSLRTILVRESIQGMYHPTSMRREGGTVRGEFEWKEETLAFLAREAFRLAAAHPPHRLTVVLKTSVLGELGEMWLDVFATESQAHPDVRYAHRASGAGFSDMWLQPREFGVVVTDDQSGDILADLIPSVLYSSRNLVAAGNLSMEGHASFQTDHGTIRPLVGKDAVNPLAMLNALAMALRHGLREEAQGSASLALGDSILAAMGDVLDAGARTEDFFEGAPQSLVGTTEMTDRVIDRLSARLSGAQ